MKISILDRVENTGKRRQCWLSEFSSLPSMFSKPPSLGSLKVRRVNSPFHKAWHICMYMLYMLWKLIFSISPFSTMFSMQSVSCNPLIATFQLLSAASLNLGRSQSGVLGNGLNKIRFSGL